MKEIPLTRGKVALVDDEDYSYLMGFRWHAHAALSGRFYAATSRMEMMHRLLLSPPKGFEVDHIDGNGLNNQKVNLRACTHSQNLWNRKVQHHTSRYKGVFWRNAKRRWCAQIKVNGRKIHLGQSQSEEEAAEMYRRAAAQYHGEYARVA